MVQHAQATVPHLHSGNNLAFFLSVVPNWTLAKGKPWRYYFWQCEIFQQVISINCYNQLDVPVICHPYAIMSHFLSHHKCCDQCEFLNLCIPVCVSMCACVCVCVSSFLKNSQELYGDIWASLGALTPCPDFPESSASPQATWRAYWVTGLRAWNLPDDWGEIITWRFFKSLSHESGLSFFFSFLLSQVKMSSQLPFQKPVCTSVQGPGWDMVCYRRIVRPRFTS